MARNLYKLVAQSKRNKDGDVISTRVRVYDQAGNTVEDAVYSEDVYFENWKLVLLEHMTKYTGLYLLD